MALAHSHTLKAAQTTIQQSQSQEVTASLRPNPALGWDALFFPVDPSDWTASNLEQNQQFDLGLSYLFERGGKRRRRVEAARDATASMRTAVESAGIASFSSTSRGEPPGAVADGLCAMAP